MSCCGTRRRKNQVLIDDIEEPIPLPKKINGLTPDDIQKLKTNLNNLIDFNDLSYMNTNPVITEVYFYLNSVKKVDPGLSIFQSLLNSSYELIGELPIPGAGIISWFIGGILDSYSSDTEPNLNIDFGDVATRYQKTYYQIRTDLTTMYDDPTQNLDKVYNINFGDKKTITLRELLNYTVPTKDDLDFTKLLQAHTRGFRSSLCQQELPKSDQFKICGVFYQGGWDVPNSIDDVFFPYGISNDYLYIDNSELRWGDHESERSYVKVDMPENSMDALKKASAEFCQKCSQTLITNFAEQKDDNGNTIYIYHKYHVMDYVDEDRPSSGFWRIATDSFCNWLFKDDGFGNITNPDGCGNRGDIFRNWGMKWGNQIDQVPHELTSGPITLKKMFYFTRARPVTNTSNVVVNNQEDNTSNVEPIIDTNIIVENISNVEPIIDTNILENTSNVEPIIDVDLIVENLSNVVINNIIEENASNIISNLIEEITSNVILNVSEINTPITE